MIFADCWQIPLSLYVALSFLSLVSCTQARCWQDTSGHAFPATLKYMWHPWRFQAAPPCILALCRNSQNQYVLLLCTIGLHQPTDHQKFVPLPFASLEPDSSVQRPSSSLFLVPMPWLLECIPPFASQIPIRSLGFLGLPPRLSWAGEVCFRPVRK